MPKFKLIPMCLILSLLFTSGPSYAKEQEYRTIIDFQYDELSYGSDSYVVAKGNRYAVMSGTGKTVLPLQASVLYMYREGMAKILKSGKYGFINSAGKVVVSPKWDYAGSFFGGLASVMSNYKYGFIDADGKVVIAPQWDYVENFTKDGVVCVMTMNKKDKLSPVDMLFYKGLPNFGKWGLVNKTGKILMKTQWDYITPMSGNESLFLVMSKGKYGIADSTGKFTIEPSLGSVTYFEDGYELSPVSKQGKWGFINRKGEPAAEFQWDGEPVRLEGTKLWMVAKKDPSSSYHKFYGAVDDSGRVVIEPAYDQDLYFRDGISKIAVRYGNNEYTYGYINDAGAVVCKPGPSEAKDFSEGVAWVCGRRDPADVQKEYSGSVDEEMLRYRWRPVDKTGRYLKLTGWDRVTDFKNGYAAVSNEEGKSAIIDKEFNTVCELAYDVVYCLSNGLFIVNKNKKYGVVDRTGKIIYKPDIDDYGYWDEEKNGVFLRQSNWSEGVSYSLLGKTGKLLGNTRWNGYDSVVEGFIPVKLKDKWGLINVESEAVAVSPQFDDMYYSHTEKGESIWRVTKNGKRGIIAVKIPGS